MSRSLAALLFAGAFAAANQAAEPANDFFEKSIRPLLADHCWNCHGSDRQKAGLRLDSRPAMMTGGDSGAVIVPGRPEESLLIKAVHYKEDLRMPPKGPLAGEQVALLTLWIKQGAVWPMPVETRKPVTGEANQTKISAKDRAFWSFQPITDPPLPKIQDTSWVKTSIDHFVLAKLEASKLKPVEAAGRRELIRRATFDLIGLPPTPEEVEAFVRDDSADAFRKVVDRLLASPHYGERWARHWLDVARYGEDQAHTFQARKYPQGFRYRDWLVKALNADMPFDQFIKEQLAADVLPRSGAAERIENLPALGFFALGPVYYGDAKKLDQFDDRIDTLTRGLLGLTVACARCHDHKFDPISTKDYYSLAGIIASTEYVELSLEPGKEGEPLVNTPPKDKKKPEPKGAHIHAVKEGSPVNLAVHVRGNPNNLGDMAPRGFLSILTEDDARPYSNGSGRLELANALATRDNPLTARVIVNRLWQHHFGKGLVRTPSNFGALGEPPTHPELLDHLATKFIASGWSMKSLHRDIMLSAVYQLSCTEDGANNSVDEDNKLLWRANRRRLQVEAWRDAMLAVSGKLDRTFAGPSTDLASADHRRRTLYGAVSRHELNPLLRLFDFPDPNITSDDAFVTTVPLQQLFVLNSDFLVNNAKGLVARLATTANDDAERIGQAFLLLYSRPATPHEMHLGLTFLSAPNASQNGLTRWEQYAQALLSTNEFLYVD